MGEITVSDEPVRQRDWIDRARKFKGPFFSFAWAVTVLGLWYLFRNPRTKLLHGSDVMSLIGCGMCFGVALAYLLRVLRKGLFR